MTTDFIDPNDEDEELVPSLEEEYSDAETDEYEIEPDKDGTISAIDAETIPSSTEIEKLLPENALAPSIDLEQFWQDGIQQGNDAVEAIARKYAPMLPGPIESQPGVPEAIGPRRLPPARPGDGDPQKLPAGSQPESTDIELYATTQNSTAQQASPERPPEIPPVVIHHLPPQIAGSEKNTAKESRERLRIEVEITLANAERISRIAIEEAKAEFKKLASQATQRLDEKFYEYRANQRLLRRS